MKKNNLYTTLKPYLAIGATLVCLTTFNASAIGTDNVENKAQYGQKMKGEQQGKRQHRMKKHFKMLAKKLDLTKAQRQEVKSIFAEMKVSKKSHRNSMKGFKEEVNVLTMAPTFNETKFKSIYAQSQENFAQVAMERAKMRHKIMQVLTPEQQEKFQTMRTKRAPSL